MAELLPEQTDLLGGLELGGVPLATVLSQLTGIPAVFIRKQAKTYGTCRRAEGADVAGRSVTLVEDVITTGGAVRDTVLALRELGAAVDLAVCAIDRRSPGDNRLDEVGVTTRSAIRQGELAPASGLGTAIHERFAGLGLDELELPPRDELARVIDFGDDGGE